MHNTLTLYLVSTRISNIEAFINSVEFRNFNYCHYSTIEQTDNAFRLRIWSHTYIGYETEVLNRIVMNDFHNPIDFRTILDMYGLDCLLSYTDTITGEDDSISDFVFERDFLYFTKAIKSSIEVIVLADTIEEDGTNTCGSYFYITSQTELDEPTINRIVDSGPTIHFKSGDVYPGGWAIQNYYCWGIEVVNEGTLPGKSIRELMTTIHNPDVLGDYCKTRGLKTHIDVTYYGIHNKKIEFIVDYRFLLFCSSLNVEWMDIDFMF